MNIMHAGASGTSGTSGKSKDPRVWKGYNVKDKFMGDMEDAGIIDPTKVTRIALENAASVAGIVLLTECVIVDIEEDKPNNPMEGMF